MRFLLVLLLLGACAHTPKPRLKPQSTVVDNSDPLLLSRIGVLEYQVRFEWFDRTIDNCFWDYRLCKLETKSKGCWDKHEACVINAYNRWELINVDSKKHKKLKSKK